MTPSWDKHPELGRGRMGWRMGYGEEYLNGFWQWFSRLSKDEKGPYEVRLPEAEGWSGFYERIRAHPWLK